MSVQNTANTTGQAGFTLSWTTNDSVATEMLCLALAPQRRIVVSRLRRPTRMCVDRSAAASDS